ncbi:MAG TPA: hypothetical protein VGO92_14975 [Acidimicrobiales bacterium]|jgi:hypothetical protein|nr:hypothetical protein [Acidimicrobiales bacterium]
MIAFLLLVLVWSAGGMTAKWYFDGHRDTYCDSTERPPADLPAATLGLPPSNATLTPEIGFQRNVGRHSTSWASGKGAPLDRRAFKASSSSLVSEGGGSVIPADAVAVWGEVQGGITTLTACVDPTWTDKLSNGTYAGFAIIPTADNALTVREQVSVQAWYAGYLWPIGFVMLAIGLMFIADRLETTTKAVRWMTVATGAGAFAGTYYSTVYANPSWGGASAISAFVVTAFTATTGALATASTVTKAGRV